MMRALVAALALSAASPLLAAEPDAYSALKAMDGHWIATATNGHTRAIDNTCARTGLFFVCEQAVGGTPAAIVVFMPKGHEERKLVFRTQTLTAGGDRPGPWREVTIEDGVWTYADLEHSAGGKRRFRITHSGPDYMHAETQVSAKDDDWITVSSENLTRAP